MLGLGIKIKEPDNTDRTAASRIPLFRAFCVLVQVHDCFAISYMYCCNVTKLKSQK